MLTSPLVAATAPSCGPRLETGLGVTPCRSSPAGGVQGTPPPNGRVPVIAAILRTPQLTALSREAASRKRKAVSRKAAFREAVSRKREAASREAVKRGIGDGSRCWAWG